MHKRKEQHVWSLFVDGASRNNPGPSGAGIYLVKNNVLFIKCGYYLGIKTNNQAEYLALLIGLFIVSEHVSEDDVIHVTSDSLLMIRQLSGLYKVKQPHLHILYKVAKDKIDELGATLYHVLRSENTEADEMANHGVDMKQLPPKNYISLLNSYDIYL